MAEIRINTGDMAEAAPTLKAGDRVLLKFDDGSYNVSGTAALDSLSIMDHNLYFNAKGKAEFEILGSKLSLADWKQSSKNTHKYDQNSIMEDPQFVNVQNRDYRLKADSPAMAIGITIQVKLDYCRISVTVIRAIRPKHYFYRLKIKGRHLQQSTLVRRSR